MAKTRSQTGNMLIKKEQDCKDNVLLNGDNNTIKRKNKIAKRKPSRSNNRNLPVQQVKAEEDTDIKSLLQSSSNLPKGQRISQEQINQLFDYVVNQDMSVTKASHMVNMSKATGRNYYNLYENDPDKKIPSARSGLLHHTRFPTQEQIKTLIKYISEDKMTIAKASAKASMNYDSGIYYYSKYLEDPNHAIPVPRQNYTQDQKNKLIGYIVNDKMTITAASKKAIMDADAGLRYYHKYIDDGHAAPSHIISRKRYTQEQIKELIRYIVDDKMTIRAASRKANINKVVAGRYYRLYLKDNNMEYPVPKYCKHYTR